MSVLGTVGWTALGAAGATTGVLLVAAAVRFDPAAPVGLDAGIRMLAGQPFGPVLLLVLAAAWRSSPSTACSMPGTGRSDGCACW